MSSALSSELAQRYYKKVFNIYIVNVFDIHFNKV